MRLGNKFRSAKFRVGETKNEELVGIGVRSSEVKQEVVVVGHPEGMHCVTLILHIRSKRCSFDFGGDWVHDETIRSQHLHHIQEERLADGAWRGLGSIQVGNVISTIQVDL
jgi:hypothetical protein